MAPRGNSRGRPARLPNSTNFASAVVPVDSSASLAACFELDRGAGPEMALAFAEGAMPAEPRCPDLAPVHRSAWGADVSRLLNSFI